MPNSVVKGKRVLVTGGTGTVGRWVVHRVLQHDPEVVRIVDIDESGLFEFRQELRQTVHPDRVRFLVGDVRDKERMARAVEQIDFVVHCAALKHVELSEYNPFEAVQTNIMGVQNVINVCMDEEVDSVLFTSSDKAANPSNMMGATKLVGEKLFVAANHAKGPRRTKFAAVRFGNVLGSRGSIIPLFTKQISDGGPVTITDPEMTRFVLTQREATDLVMRALEKMVGGEVFVPKMRALRVKDLIDVMVRELGPRHGRRPADIKVHKIGVKAGEKLYEELVTPEEAGRTYDAKHDFVVLSSLRETLSPAELAYTKLPRVPTRQLSSDRAPKLTKTQVRDLLRHEGFV